MKPYKGRLSKRPKIGQSIDFSARIKDLADHYQIPPDAQGNPDEEAILHALMADHVPACRHRGKPGPKTGPRVKRPPRKAVGRPSTLNDVYYAIVEVVDHIRRENGWHQHGGDNKALRKILEDRWKYQYEVRRRLPYLIKILSKARRTIPGGRRNVMRKPPDWTWPHYSELLEQHKTHDVFGRRKIKPGMPIRWPKVSQKSHNR